MRCLDIMRCLDTYLEGSIEEQFFIVEISIQKNCLFNQFWINSIWFWTIWGVDFKVKSTFSSVQKRMWFDATWFIYQNSKINRNVCINKIKSRLIQIHVVITTASEITQTISHLIVSYLLQIPLQTIVNRMCEGKFA